MGCWYHLCHECSPVTSDEIPSSKGTFGSASRSQASGPSSKLSQRPGCVAQWTDEAVEHAGRRKVAVSIGGAYYHWYVRLVFIREFVVLKTVTLWCAAPLISLIATPPVLVRRAKPLPVQRDHSLGDILVPSHGDKQSVAAILMCKFVRYGSGSYCALLWPCHD